MLPSSKSRIYIYPFQLTIRTTWIIITCYHSSHTLSATEALARLDLLLVWGESIRVRPEAVELMRNATQE